MPLSFGEMNAFVYPHCTFGVVYFFGLVVVLFR